MLDTHSDVYQPKPFEIGEITSVIVHLPKARTKMTLINLETVKKSCTLFVRHLQLRDFDFRNFGRNLKLSSSVV